MILGEFAINPAAIKDWSDLKNITMNFGFHNGAVISEFPKTWIGILKEKAKKELDGSVKYLEVIERLTLIKQEYLIKKVRKYTDQETWIDNAVKEHANESFYKIINDSEVPDSSDVVSFENIDETLFEHLREGVINRHAENIAISSKLLIECSKNIKIIDPFFNNHRGYQKTIGEIFTLLSNNRRPDVKVEVHASFIQGGNEVNIEREKEKLQQYLPKVIPKGSVLTVIWWNDNDTKELHPRYLVTERGGIRYDRGFLEPSELSEKETETDVSMMTRKMADEVWNKYRDGTSKFSVVDQISIEGSL